MLALRSFARSAPKAARASTRVVRPQLFRPAAAFQQSWAPATPRLAASFHMSAVRRQEGTGNEGFLHWLGA
jgi:complement component 1 Q subcomponent-binding protein